MALASSACLDRPIGSPPPVTTNIFVDRITQTSVDKIDLLFMIDNSISMSDKQAILGAAVPDLVSRLVNPICVDAAGNQFPAPPEGSTTCPAGQTQEFNPIKDINIGIVSSSLGDVGANVACPEMGFPKYKPDQIDMAHLIGSLTRGRNSGANAQGFLEWRAGGANPTDLSTFNLNFQKQVTAVGEQGCGWEASLESWYRFLIDPVPYQQLARVPCRGSTSTANNCVQPATGPDSRILLDTALLAQRDAFLRDDSLVAIIMLTDENDCSAQVGNQTWVVFNIEDTRPMFKGSSACADDPNAKCCYSCPLQPPAGCSPDPACASDPANLNRLSAELDGQNLRCYQQKRRFGVDFLYPTQRYVNALTQFDLCWNSLDLSTAGCDQGDVRDNPLFEGGRLPSLVFLGGIVGVPWQAIQATKDANGRDIAANNLRFKSYKELTADRVWDQILGSPGTPWRAAAGSQPEVAGSPGIPPLLAQMVESPQFPRAGITRGNAINGRDYDTTQGTATQTGAAPRADDLQYACIFPLNPTRDCATKDPNVDNCDCYQGVLDRPLCEQTPGGGAPGTTQYWAKAYPGVRELQVLKDFGEKSTNSIVASICARNVAREADPDFGYRPAIAAIVDRLKEQLGNRCLPRALSVDEDGSVPCNLVETTPQPPKDPVTGAELACPRCEAQFARKDPEPNVDSVVRGQLSREQGKPCGANDPTCSKACLCEVQQVQDVQGADKARALQTCRQDLDAVGVEGWCYVDADARNNPELVRNCPATQKRLLRFVGRGLGANTTTFVACTGSSFAARDQ
ncbi:MAG: hypothetical protein ABI895_38320 [Deltaproteobacteria bacterium]